MSERKYFTSQTSEHKATYSASQLLSVTMLCSLLFHLTALLLTKLITDCSVVDKIDKSSMGPPRHSVHSCQLPAARTLPLQASHGTADCVLDTATSSCCCTSHRPHLEKICKQAGGSRSLTHADGPLWAALLNVQSSLQERRCAPLLLLPSSICSVFGPGLHKCVPILNYE